MKLEESHIITRVKFENKAGMQIMFRKTKKNYSFFALHWKIH